jgi:hypothetical protein
MNFPFDITATQLRFNHDDVADYKPKTVVDDGGGPKEYEKNYPWMAFHFNNTTDGWLCRYKTGMYFEVTSVDTSGYDAAIVIVHNALKFTEAAASQGFVCKELGWGTVAYFSNESKEGGRGGPMGVEFNCLPGLIGTTHNIGAGGMGAGFSVGSGGGTDAIGFWPTNKDDGTAMFISSVPNDAPGHFRHTQIKMNGDIELREGAVVKRAKDKEGLFERIEALEERLKNA